MGQRIGLSLMVAAVLCLGACGTRPNWVKTGATEEDFARDSHQCERDARASAGERGPGLAGGGGLAAEFESGGYQAGCLRRRGWTLAAEPPAESPSAAEPPAPASAPTEAPPPKPAM
jgi:hypothetical protein